MNKIYDIYGLGAALVDTEITLRDSDLENMNIEKGVMTLVDEARQHELMQHLHDHLMASKRASGGSAANTIIAASYLGCKAMYSCKVANDENGRFYLNDLKDAGVAIPYSVQPAAVVSGITGKCLVLITPDAERTMNTFLGISAALSTQEIDEAAIAQSHYVYLEGYLVTSPTGKAAAIHMRNKAKENGVKVALSLSDPAMVHYFKEGIKEMVGSGAQAVDFIFCNQEEAISFTETTNLSDAAQALKNISPQFAITMGAQGAMLYDGKELIQVSAPKIKPIDTNGAGDMFAGAFLAAHLQGKSFAQAGEFACAAAAQVVSQYGPRLKAEQYAHLHSMMGKLSI